MARPRKPQAKRPETFACTVVRGGSIKTDCRPGVRVSKHFAFVEGALTHLPSGMKVPGSECETVMAATTRAECLEALACVDWRRKDPTRREFSDEQLEHLRAAAQGAMPPEGARWKKRAAGGAS